MAYQNLIVSLQDGILQVTINREKALNALNSQTLAELKSVFTMDALEKQVTGVIITGAGPKAFVAGADISEFLNVKGKGGELAQIGQDIFFQIENFSKPVVAAVNGFALGGGCELAMACHIRVAAENARFGQPEVNLGLIPGYGGTQRLVKLIGKGKALELLMTADMIDASEAFRLGLVNHVVPEGQLIEKAIEILHKIAKKAPVAISKVIECVNQEGTLDGYTTEVEKFNDCTGTNDFIEGVNAFLEKRPANFKGE